MATYIKSLAMHGFKSFAKRTEVPFDRTLSVVVGPNGSGKSNVTEAICFVLGRLSAKSMRASKTSNLIYNGGKAGGAAEEAVVELVFDNSERTFSVEKPEVKIARVVRTNGNSIYKINNEVKTRQEVLELLSQAGIDPDGFNIILQEEIAKFVEMHPEERRQIIEEVAGISIYEERKHKSLLELDRTREKIKEINTVLSERTTYLRNLDKEREQALHHEKTKKLIERDKAALLFRQLEDKQKEDTHLANKIEEETKVIEKLRTQIVELEEKTKKLGEEIEGINKQIEKSTGVEQGQLHEEISNLRADTAALNVKFENLTQQLQDHEKRKEQLEKELKELNSKIDFLKESIPKEDLKKIMKVKSESLSSLEEKKEKLDKLKSEMIKVKSDLEHNKMNYESVINRVGFLQQRVAEIFKTHQKEPGNLEDVLKKIENNFKEIRRMEEDLLNSHRRTAEFRKEISLLEKIKKDISDLDMCPICRRKVTHEHIKEVHSNSDSDIKKLNHTLEKEIKQCSDFEKKIGELKKELEELRSTESKLRISTINESNLKEKNQEKERLEREKDQLQANVSALEKRLNHLDTEIGRYKELEKEYGQLREELKDISRKDEQINDLSRELALKNQDIERIQSILKKMPADKKQLEISISEIKKQLDTSSKSLEEREQQNKKIYEDFQKTFKKRTSLQDTLRQFEEKLIGNRINLRNNEDNLNVLKISKAKTSAELETYTNEFEQYKSLDIESLKLKQSRAEIEDRIKRNEIEIAKIGSVNLRALEVYDKVKEEYDSISEKVTKLESENQEILNVIEDIDKKKKKSFMKVFDELNHKFSEYFLRLGGREAYLDIENKEDPFQGGVDIEVKINKAKYLDVSSLSGGERVLVALSLIFSIQELKPYCFYVFDEIDAALDKRNSERLAGILKTYMKNAQYIVITHNDSLITEANSLYGVSMQDGVSKVLSLKV